MNVLLCSGNDVLFVFSFFYAMGITELKSGWYILAVAHIVLCNYNEKVVLNMMHCTELQCMYIAMHSID